jgi:hypothetical protein
MSDQYEEDDRYGEGYSDAMRARLRAGDDKRPLTLEDIKGMTQDQINAQWDDVQAVLRNQS